MRVYKSTLAILLATLNGHAWALEPQGIRLGDAVVFTPTLSLAGRYDDNFRAVENNAESSFISRLSPSFVFGVEGAKSAYELTYRAESDTFYSSPEDDNTDHHLTLNAGYEFNARHRLALDLGYHKVEETASEEQHLDNDRSTISNVGGVYTFGARSARAQVDIAADYQELRFQNADHVNADRERNTTALSSTLYYALVPKTKALVETRHTLFDYLSNQNLDSQNTAVLGGISWDATAKTNGSFRVGGERKTFDNGNQPDLSGSLWELGATWKPRTYSVFDLTARQGIDEGSSGASAIEAQSATLSWKHQWRERFSSDFSYTWSNEQYENVEREDRLERIGIGATYKMNRWLDLKAGYKHTENDSSAAGESYRRNLFELGVDASL